MPAASFLSAAGSKSPLHTQVQRFFWCARARFVTDNLIKSGARGFTIGKAIQASAINATDGEDGVYVYADDNDFTESSLPHHLTITDNTIRKSNHGIHLDGDHEDLNEYPNDPHTFYYKTVSLLNNPINADSEVGLDLSNQYNVFTGNNIVYNTVGNNAVMPVVLP